MKNYYELLGLAQTAPHDEIKRAFRQQIARYHPDKVQHLGQEFQVMAAERAAELTEAYRVLSQRESRHAYDAELSLGGAPAATATRPQEASNSRPVPPPVEDPQPVPVA